MKVKRYRKTGAYHMLNGENCQDAVLYSELSDYAIAVIADGVSSAQKGGLGAETACKATEDFIRREKDRVFEFSEEKLAYLLLEHILYFIENIAGESGEEIVEYASTLAVACIEKSTGRALVINLGDGAIFLLRDSKLSTLMAPKRYFGVPCQTTTEGAYKAVDVKMVELHVDDSVLLGTDGFLDVLARDKRQNGLIKELIQFCAFDELNKELLASDENDDCSYIVMTRA